MMISCNHLCNYLSSMDFPVDVYEERGDKVAHTCHTRHHLELLISEGAVFGIGNNRRIKRLRLQKPVKIRVDKKKDRQLPIAEDNRTVIIVSRTFSHHPGRCSSYNRYDQRDRLVGSCL